MKLLETPFLRPLEQNLSQMDLQLGLAKSTQLRKSIIR